MAETDSIDLLKKILRVGEALHGSKFFKESSEEVKDYDETYMVDFIDFNVSSLTRIKNPISFFKMVCLDIISLVQRAEAGIADGYGFAKRIKSDLKRIRVRAGVFLSHIERAELKIKKAKKGKYLIDANVKKGSLTEMKLLDLYAAKAGYLLMNDILILKEIYFEFLEFVGRSIKELFSDFSMHDLDSLKAELIPFKSNKIVLELIVSLENFMSDPKPVADAYLNLSKDAKKNKAIRQIRNLLKLAA
ncbi:hypothetical protein DRJ25_00785 [Candidatus Woesearchaeota archaeon]|nr:MAG: hypothetical protein DRJ25_00785 [Candidatus Woesearchaeota archaeon]